MQQIKQLTQTQIIAYTNVNLDFQKHITKKYIKKILIIYAGGTIGMKWSEQGYKPVNNSIQQYLKSNSYFIDNQYMQNNNLEQNLIIAPPSMLGKRISYKIITFHQIIDSCENNPKYIRQLLSLIKQNFKNFDAFVILHGTDTLAYTASALSFMIKNLQKTIIMTGSNLPITQNRNDAFNNILGSLTIAGHYDIPQILIVFDNKIYRGNRCIKNKIQDFDAFISPNFPVIGQLESRIKINWQLILTKPHKHYETQFFFDIQDKLGLLKLHPFINIFHYQTLFNDQSIKGICIQVYGSGNCPNIEKLSQWIHNCVLREVLITFISQVSIGMIRPIYQSSKILIKAGAISGGDMTLQACLSKMAYLIGIRKKKNYSFITMLHLFQKDLRGELTQQELDIAQVTIRLLFQQKFKDKQQQISKKLIKNIIDILKFGSEEQLIKLKELGLNFKKINSQGNTLLHQIIKYNNIQQYVQFLIKSQKINVNSLNIAQQTPLDFALQKKFSILLQGISKMHFY